MVRTNRTIITLVLTVAVVAVAGTGALAAKGGGKGSGGGKPGGTSSGTGVVLVALTPNDGQVHWGQQVTFTVSTSATNRPFVSLTCSQGGVRVYSFSAGIFPDYAWTQTYTLESNMWTGGAADCTATGYYFSSNGREVVFGTLGFGVAA